MADSVESVGSKRPSNQVVKIRNPYEDTRPAVKRRKTTTADQSVNESSNSPNQSIDNTSSKANELSNKSDSPSTNEPVSKSSNQSVKIPDPYEQPETVRRKKPSSSQSINQSTPQTFSRIPRVAPPVEQPVEQIQPKPSSQSINQSAPIIASPYDEKSTVRRKTKPGGNQPINQSINRTVDPLIRVAPLHAAVNQPTLNQSVNQPVIRPLADRPDLNDTSHLNRKQSINQSTNLPVKTSIRSYEVLESNLKTNQSINFDRKNFYDALRPYRSSPLVQQIVQSINQSTSQPVDQSNNPYYQFNQSINQFNQSFNERRALGEGFGQSLLIAAEGIGYEMPDIQSIHVPEREVLDYGELID